MNLIKQDEINGILGFRFDVSPEEFINSITLSDKFYLPTFFISFALFLFWFFNPSIILFYIYLIPKVVLIITSEKYIFGKLMLNDMIKSYNLYHESRQDYIKYDNFELSKKYDIQSNNGTNKRLLEKFIFMRKLVILLNFPITFLPEIIFLIAFHSLLLFL